MKTWGYLVAIGATEEIETSLLEGAVDFYLDDPQYDYLKMNSIEVTSLGEIETFPEPKESNNGSL